MVLSLHGHQWKRFSDTPPFNNFKSKITPLAIYPIFPKHNALESHLNSFFGRISEVIFLPISKIHIMEGNKDNGFIPDLLPESMELIYLCFLNNPTAWASKKNSSKNGSIMREKISLWKCPMPLTKYLSAKTLSPTIHLWSERRARKRSKGQLIILDNSEGWWSLELFWLI